MNKIFIIILFSIFYCVEADKKEQTVNLPINSKLQKEWEIEDNYKFKMNNLDFEILYLKPSSSLMYGLFSNLIVDNLESASHHISSNYIITIGIIQNKNNQKRAFSRRNLILPYRGNSLKPILPLQYPSSISCINWKGSIKSAYNVSVFSLSTIYVVGSIVSCVKGNKCEGLEYIDNVINLSTSGETNPSNIISHPVFTSKLESNDLEIYHEIVLQPKETKEILILYKKPSLMIDSEKVLTSGNCIVK
jgi:hypothetical protein